MVYHVQFPNLGLAFTVDRVAFSLGGFSVYWYGILIALGLVLAMAFAFRYAPDFGINTDRLIDVVLIGTVMSIVCARAYYVAFAPFTYQSFWEMIDIRQGSIAIYGAVIGAFVFGGLAAKWRRVPILPLFDLAAMGFLIGQGIGRWGNFVNQEAFGTNTTLPWGMYSEGTQSYLASVQSALAGEGITVNPTMPVHPTFLYESIWCLAGLALLWLFMRKRRFNGEIFLLYVIWYGLGRYWIEGLRTDSLMLTANLRTSQMVALVSVAASVVLLVAGLQRARGRELAVPLAVTDLKKQAAAGSAFAVEELPARTPHKQFVAATEAMNRRLAELELSRSDAPAAESDAPAPAPEQAPEQPAQPEPAEQPEQPAQPESEPTPAAPEQPAQQPPEQEDKA